MQLQQWALCEGAFHASLVCASHPLGFCASCSHASGPSPSHASLKTVPAPRPPTYPLPCLSFPKISNSALLFAVAAVGNLTVLRARSMCSLMRARDRHRSSLLHYAGGSGHLPTCHFLANLMIALLQLKV
mmetsp:Transcript_5224/g.10591  ORF Transcript_5224/g.10591 Transcript_5224/m.10591 type:complete len:130 (-) Transcript_5224:457-846(-)